MNDSRSAALRTRIVQAALRARRPSRRAGAGWHLLLLLFVLALSTAPAWAPAGAHDAQLDRGLAAGSHDLLARAARNLKP